MPRYCDYIAVDQDYVPVFSAEQDASYPTKWEQFVPHSSLRRVFEALVQALERTSAASKKPVWVSGTYGTGKTYAAFLIKHLLEDDPAVVERYFLGFKDSPFTKGFDERIMALRKTGPYVVVYRSGVSGIRSSRMLLAEMQRSIAEELRRRGMQWRTQTIADGICARIIDPKPIFNWPEAFEKYKDRFDDRFEDASQVVELIRKDASPDLLDDIAEVLEAEGFSTFSTVDEVKDWIEEVIAINDLAGIVFIWDELTDFFTREAPIDTLQELAHASGRMPFYLYLITHRSPEQLGLQDSTWRVLYDRFHHVKFEMENQTAYELIQSTLKPIPATSRAWENRKDQLWDKVRGAIRPIREQDPELSDRQARALLPIHPYSAYLITNISRYMSSSQRTLFQFLQTNEPGSFVDFCNDHPSGSPPTYFLTADYLWDYFFKAKTDELPSKAHQAIDYYQNIEQYLENDNERKAAKATLLLYVLHHQISGVRLLKPTSDNLCLAFYGTPLGEHICNVMQSLCARKIFHSIGISGSEEYTITLVGIDQEELDRYVADAKRTYSLDYLVSKNQPLEKELAALFRVSAFDRRQNIIVLSAGDLIRNGKRTLERGPKSAPFQITTIIVVASDRTEGQLCRAQMEAQAKDPLFDRTAFVLLEVPFSEDHRVGLAQEYAQASYARQMGDSALARHHNGRSHQSIMAWIDSVKSHRHTVLFRDQKREITVDYFPKFLDAVVASVYPFRPESFYPTSTAYRATSGKRGAEIGLGLTSNAKGEYAGIIDKLNAEGIWNDPTSFCESNVSHPLSKMKAAMDNLFEASDSMTVPDLWSLLQSPPFGLFESSMAMVIMGLLMRQFSSGYYKYDGVTSTALGPSDLVEMIESAVKDRKNASRFEIRRMSEIDEKLCSLISNLLGYSLEDVKYPKLAQQKLRLVIANLGYPIWSLCYLPNLKSNSAQHTRSASLIRTLDDFSKFSGEFGQVSYREIAERLVDNSDYIDEIRPLMTRGYFSDGFKGFVHSIDPQITSFASELGLSTDDLRAMIASLKNEESWLWDEKSIENRLPDVASQLRLISALSLVNQKVQPSIESSLVLLDELFFRANLPDVLLTECGTPELNAITRELLQLVRAPEDIYKFTVEERNELAARISEQSEVLRIHLMDSSGAIMRFTSEHLGYDISEEEAYILDPELRRLPCDTPPNIIETTISSKAESIKRDKLAIELMRVWSTLTNSSSPSEWSIENGIPIQWVIGDSRWLYILDIINSPTNRTLSEIQDALSYIKKCEQGFEALRDTNHIKQCLYDEAIAMYFDIPSGIINTDDLSAFLKKHVTDDVYSWPSRPAEIRTAVETWMKHKYEFELNAIKQYIHAIDESTLRELLEELVSDAATGLKILTILSTKLDVLS